MSALFGKASDSGSHCRRRHTLTSLKISQYSKLPHSVWSLHLASVVDLAAVVELVVVVVVLVVVGSGSRLQ